ncbi:hypothetical protein PENVUL_c004G05752 [Penicillium vulpinum]|uniref:SRR1-like domain-containing protein n=1 Tax=Penicillium vulpinum TaxID=29845 RepID=A0A1V6S9X8_9EURO|nr:hypothetical protein PENVUL_c004G05752 [Penicillium vulpinum]
MPGVRAELWDLVPILTKDLLKTSIELGNQPGRQLVTMKREAAIKLLDEWHKADLPYFTIEALQDLEKQLEPLHLPNVNTGEVSLAALTGTIFKGEMNLGHCFVSKLYESKVETKMINLRFVIEYNHPARLMDSITLAYKEGADVPVMNLMPFQMAHEVFECHNLEEPSSCKIAGDAFKNERQAWEKTETCRKLPVTLSRALGHEINSIVGFSCGSLSLPGRSKAAFQHALLVTIKDWLIEQGNGKKPSCYLQDPEYTDVDKEILHSVDFDVVHDPTGFLKVNDKSVVLSIGSDAPTKQIIADIARPAIVIWVRHQGDGLLDYDSSRVMNMMKDYDMYELGDAPQFRKAVIYIRKPVLRARVAESVLATRKSAILKGLTINLKHTPIRT